MLYLPFRVRSNLITGLREQGSLRPRLGVKRPRLFGDRRVKG